MSQDLRTVFLVSLGCAKNRVDTEVMLGHLLRAGYEVALRADEADVIVVNTCGFIGPAKQESVDAILEMAELRERGSCKRLVVTGCLSQRYSAQLAVEIPEVDDFLGTGNFERIVQVLQRDRSRTSALREPRGQVPDPDFTLTAASPRIPTLPGHMSYLKVSEGCSQRCAFCVIPQLRGPQRSRPVADVLREARRHLEAGVAEINLLAQDLCAYGKDLSPRESLADLLSALEQLGQGATRRVWIRCLYAYPRGLTREVIRILARAQHIVPYLDMPLQHISSPVLRRMRRGRGGEATRALVRRLRAGIEGLALRTTLIAGLPGESEADFEELCEFVAEARFEHLGVFVYSPEEGTEAADMPQQVDPEVAAERRDILMRLQRRISREQQAAMVGRRLEVLIEGLCEETELLLQGRHAGQGPEVDGVTYITGGTASPGQFVQVLVEEAGDYDLAGRIVDPINSDP